MRPHIGPTLIVLLTVAACGGASPGSGAAAASPSGVSTAATRSACSLLTLEEVRRIVPDAASSAPRALRADADIDVCSWKDASGKRSVVDVSVWKISGTDDTPLGNVRTLATGLVDPLRGDAEKAIRLETIGGLGEGAGAVAFVERMDPARGIIGTGALLALQKNGRIATVQSSSLAGKDRTAALDGLRTLGRTVAGRL